MSEPAGGGGEDGSAGLEVSAVQNVADVAVLQKHLRKLVPLLLEDGGEAPAALEAALEEKSALEQMRKFLSDPQVHTVLVERSTLKGAAPPASPARPPAPPHAPGAPRTPRPGRRPRAAGEAARPRPPGARSNGTALSARPKMAELGGDGASRPLPGLPCHMSFPVSLWAPAGRPPEGRAGGRAAAAGGWAGEAGARLPHASPSLGWVPQLRALPARAFANAGQWRDP